MNIYRLVTFGEEVQLTLTTAKSSDRRTAVQELRRWAIANGHAIAESAEDLEATCVIEELIPVD